MAKGLKGIIISALIQRALESSTENHVKGREKAKEIPLQVVVVIMVIVVSLVVVIIVIIVIVVSLVVVIIVVSAISMLLLLLPQASVDA